MAHTNLRRIIASAGALGGAVCMRSWGGSLPGALWLPTALLAASALLVWRRQVGGQLLARAVWWSNLILGTLIATSGNGHERPVAALLALATGTALLSVGRGDLDGDTASGAFSPLAFRGTLVCLLVMAMADAQSLLLFGALELTDGPRALHLWSVRGLPLAVAVPLAVSVIGLYRLRLWGLVLDLAASLALGLFAVTGRFDLPTPLLVAYALTAGAQWLVALPLVIAILRRRAPASTSRLSRRGFALSASLITLMMVSSLLLAFVVQERLF